MQRCGLAWLGLGLAACTTPSKPAPRPPKPAASEPAHPQAPASEPARPQAPKKLTPYPDAPFYEGLADGGRKITTPSPLAQAYFNQGLVLLQGFNHFAASHAFEAATRADPEAAMAYVGLALANGPHINRGRMTPEQTKKAWTAIQRAKQAKHASALERAWVEALATRYVREDLQSRKELNQDYAEAMRTLWAQYPEDADIGAFFAEAMMDLRPWDLWDENDKPQPGTPEIVDTLQEVLRLRPDHPFALHLYIHAVEASPRPQDASQAAHRLRDRVPGHSHLLHMPSHIDARLGQWNLGADSNQRAIAIDQRQLALQPKQDFYFLYILHNRHMFIFMAMMAGRSAEALAQAKTLMESIDPKWIESYPGIVDGFHAMPFEVMMRFGKWEEILEAPEHPEPFFFARTLRHYARGVAYAATLEPQLARKELKAMKRAMTKIPKDRYFGSNPVDKIVAIALEVLRGEILYREGKVKAGLRALRKAVELEDQLAYDEPPSWIQPVRHALGAALLQQKRAEEAERVYRKDLEHHPNNGWALWGLARSLEMQGKSEAAEQSFRAHQQVWHRADIQLKTSCLCLPGV